MYISIYIYICIYICICTCVCVCVCVREYTSAAENYRVCLFIYAYMRACMPRKRTKIQANICAHAKEGEEDSGTRRRGKAGDSCDTLLPL